MFCFQLFVLSYFPGSIVHSDILNCSYFTGGDNWAQHLSCLLRDLVMTAIQGDPLCLRSPSVLLVDWVR